MMKKNNLGISEKSLSYIMVCVGIIALFVLAVIFPLHLYTGNQAVKIKRIKDQIEEQKILGTVYLNLQKTLGSNELQVLPNPKKTTITREEAAKFKNVFRAVAKKSGLSAISITPDLNTMGGFSKYNAVVKGEFTNFRKMLIALAAIPYLDRIEDISIQQRSDSMEFKIKIWLAVGA